MSQGALLALPIILMSEAVDSTDWCYGVSIDWAGELLKRVTGQKLGEYCREHIFEPLGCKNIGFKVTAALASVPIYLIGLFSDLATTYSGHHASTSESGC